MHTAGRRRRPYTTTPSSSTYNANNSTSLLEVFATLPGLLQATVDLHMRVSADPVACPRVGPHRQTDTGLAGDIPSVSQHFSPSRHRFYRLQWIPVIREPCDRLSTPEIGEIGKKTRQWTGKKIKKSAVGWPQSRRPDDPVRRRHYKPRVKTAY